MLDPSKIIASFNRHRVNYLIIGGFAATLHGCPEQTFDIDLIYEDSPENRSICFPRSQKFKQSGTFP